ncbi:MAG: shikimate kinase AroK, partial [Pontibacterium sp.]
GKSTIGRMLSSELKKQYIDSDHVIEERAGANIPWIFDVEGEEGFRDREEQIIAELCQEHNVILATGGGAVLREANRAMMEKSGFVVFLQTSVEQQLERTAKDKNRPILRTDDPRKVLESLKQIRDPLYKSVCNATVRTDKRHPRAVVSDIIRQASKYK